MKLDQLYKSLGYDHEARLKNLEKYPNPITRRDDLSPEEFTLLNLTGHYEEAKMKLDAHINHAFRYINEASAIDPNHIAIYQFRTLMNL